MEMEMKIGEHEGILADTCAFSARWPTVDPSSKAN